MNNHIELSRYIKDEFVIPTSAGCRRSVQEKESIYENYLSALKNMCKPIPEKKEVQSFAIFPSLVQKIFGRS
ncbi:MAG: hypothetical protein VB108_07240 [Anaerolineaceae bacterium]|nr:hypothetical protein [Anaerolineaceae bacterium]